MSAEFWQDAMEVAKARLRSGRLDRRTLLAGLAALPGLAAAQGKPRELVLANWGGDAVGAMNEAFAAPFERDHGVKVVIDSGGPSLAKIRASVEARRTVWDVCDSGAGTSFTLGRMGLLEEMDYSIIRRADIPAAFAMPWCTGTSAYSTVLTWDSSKFGGTAPASWADFWDLRRFPGRRTMRKTMHAVLEAALMADGVAPDKLYPLDVERAFRKVREIKDSIVWWNAGADSQDLLRTGEVTMGAIWSTRARLLGEETKGRIAYRWDQGVVHAGVWVVPKNPPGGREWAMRLVDSTIEPERQIILLKALGSGPANPKAAPLVPAELKPHNPTDPENLARQVFADEPWYADNYVDVFAKFTDLITG